MTRIRGNPCISVSVSMPPAPNPNISALFPGHGKLHTAQKLSVRKPSTHGQRDLWCSRPLHRSLASLSDAWLSSPRGKNERHPTVVTEEESGHLTANRRRGVVYGKVSGQTAASGWAGRWTWTLPRPPEKVLLASAEGPCTWRTHLRR